MYYYTFFMTEIVHDFTLMYFHRKKSNARRNKINAEIVFFENKITFQMQTI